MCTLTVIKQKHQVVFTFNRDEDKLRKTIPPLSYHIASNNIQYISPRDTVAGGTWIAMANNRNIAFILNGGKVKHKRKLPYKYSRGRIILDLLKSENPVHYLTETSFKGVEPFTLVTYLGEVLRELVWDGETTTLSIIPSDQMTMWSSTTLYAPEVKAERLKMLQNLPETLILSKENIKEWHQKSKQNGGLLYEGIPQVATVSTSQLILKETHGVFEYGDLLSGEQTSLQLKWKKSIALILAWPETTCKQAGAWYDGITHLLGFSKEGYYKVGHAAITLVDGRNGNVKYFDFGRYHSPHGYGRIRDEETDHDLKIKTVIQWENEVPSNLNELITELQLNASCHGDGEIKVGILPIDFEKSFTRAVEMQSEDFWAYGPFVRKGTNCSRFVRSVAVAGSKKPLRSIKMRLPWMLSPTPMWNVVSGYTLERYLKKKNKSKS